MKKLFFSITAFCALATVQAQTSFETALDVVEGLNTAPAAEVEGMSYKGAYYKYTASETTMMSLTGIDGSNFYFYTADFEQSYDYMSSYDENYVYTYTVRVEAGEMMYVFNALSWGSTEREVKMDAVFTTGEYLHHGHTADDRVTVVSGTTYYFNGEGYLTYTAEADGVLQLNQSAYSYGASYTVDGQTTEFGFDDHEASIPVAAGKTYEINVSSYGMFSLKTVFAQPQMGDTKDNPFELVLGENVLPAAAQKYYYHYVQGELGGFLTLEAEGAKMAARDIQCTCDNLDSDKTGMMRLELTPGQEVLITVEKVEATESAQVLTATFTQPAEGDIESNPIVLTPSAEAVVASAKGIKFYEIVNPSDDAQFLCVSVLTEGIDDYSASRIKVYKAGQSYQWNGQYAASTETLRLQVAGGQTNMIYVNNVADQDLQFCVWYEAIADGDVYAKPIEAVLGQNAAAAGQKYYTYTTSQECQLRVTVDPAVATVFFPSYDGDDYYGKDYELLADGDYVLAAQEGQTFVIRVTASEPTTFTIAEMTYGPGASRATAIPFDGTYAFDDLNPYKVWLVYTAPCAGVAVLNADLEGVDYNDNIQFALNDEEIGYGNNLRGYDEDYNTVMLERSLAVSEGDQIYVLIDVQSYQEGKTFTISVREAEPGEAPSKAILIASSEPVELQGVGFGDPEVWYTFTTLTDGEVLFSASEYVRLSLYDENLQQISCGVYADDLTTGGEYYQPVAIYLPAGTYYIAVVTNTDNAALQLTGVELWNGQATALNALSAAQSSAVYSISGARAASANGLLIENGKVVMRK